jgi:uncharacterized protein (TIGR00299 family) protein
VGRHLHLDPVGGMAGDMTLAALVDLGAPLDHVREGLRALPMEQLELTATAVMRGAFSALHIQVKAPDAQVSRHWSTIRTMLQEAELPGRVRGRALAIFGSLAEAEAHVHGVEIDAVHFHEVGAWDSIADIVGTCLALEALEVDTLSAGAPPLSSGSLETAHGTMPLPAPATLALLKGWPVRAGVPGLEQVTPTGAAILAALATPSPFPAPFPVHALRLLGTGTRDPDSHPNVLRATLCEEVGLAPEPMDVLRAQLDDMSGEHIPPLIDALLAAGAVDAFALPVVMKKGRPGHLIEALAPPTAADAVAEAFLRHAPTFGLRRHRTWRTTLDRHHEEVQIHGHPVRFKLGSLEGELLHATPEYDDLHAVAKATGLPLPRVHSDALAAWHARTRSTTDSDVHEP